jgi:hypothetical protein
MGTNWKLVCVNVWNICLGFRLENGIVSGLKNGSLCKGGV